MFCHISEKFISSAFFFSQVVEIDVCAVVWEEKKAVPDSRGEWGKNIARNDSSITAMTTTTTKRVKRHHYDHWRHHAIFPRRYFIDTVKILSWHSAVIFLIPFSENSTALFLRKCREISTNSD